MAGVRRLEESLFSDENLQAKVKAALDDYEGDRTNVRAVFGAHRPTKLAHSLGTARIEDLATGRLSNWHDGRVETGCPDVAREAIRYAKSALPAGAYIFDREPSGEEAGFYDDQWQVIDSTGRVIDSASSKMGALLTAQIYGQYPVALT